MEWLIRLAQALPLVAILGFSVASVAQQQTLNLYGPGGPAPAMKEAAKVFGEQRDVKVNVTAGPTNQWLDQAKEDAHLIYSGAEFMMTDFIWAMEDRIDENTVTPLYIRPSAILVRPENPKKILGFRDLLKPGIRVMVVNGAGQTGMWEDMAGRDGDIETIRSFRQNIVEFARNSGEAKKTWTTDESIDAWLIYNIWQIANPNLADLVSVEPKYVVYRDTGIALTQRGKDNEHATAFVEFLQSDEGRGIFEKWGWTRKAKP